MSPELHVRVRGLFEAALEKPEAGRLAFLQSACSGDRAVLQAVVRLLDAHRGSQTFLQNDSGPTKRIGRYLVTGELGRGAMGIVYEAIDPLIGRKVAVKVIHLQTFKDAGEAQFLRDRLFREARSAGALSHPGIVIVFDVGQEGDMAFIAMERVEGPSLYQVLAARAKIPCAEAFDILRQTAAALDYAHRNGVIHRDIKPANIMLDKGVRVKVADFGIAKITSTDHTTLTGMVMGTPSYMSPEQVEALPSHGRSDEFSLAVVAYELLTGRRPFVADSLATLAHMIVYADRPSACAVNPALPASVDVVFHRGLAKVPTGRYSSCTEFVRALEQASKDKPIPKPVISGPAIRRPVTAAPLPNRLQAPLAIKRDNRRASASVRYLLAGMTLLALAGGFISYRVLTAKPPQAATQPIRRPAAPVVTRFIADPQSIESGAAATLRWGVTGAREVVLDQGIGKVPASDAFDVRPLRATVYVLTATGPGGNVSARVSVDVTPAPRAADKAARARQLCDQALAQSKAHKPETALKLFLQAANLGDPRCMVELAETYVDEPREAEKWFRRAADAGNPAGMLQLGGMYQFGTGVLEDHEVAVYWYRQAADAGNADAMYDLGRMIENGDGASRDLVRAHRLYVKAAAQGNTEAKAELERLDGKRK